MRAYALGIDPKRPWDMQHDPPLGVRPFDEEADDYVPAENDPRYMRPMQEPAHKEVTSKVDRPAIDKTRRAGKTQAEHRQRILAKIVGSTSDSPSINRSQNGSRRTKWPKGRKIQSRGV